MDCPQCGAEVPSDDAFCGKCGYARRDEGPQRLDQSRIRVHETRRPMTGRAEPALSSELASTRCWGFSQAPHPRSRRPCHRLLLPRFHRREKCESAVARPRRQCSACGRSSRWLQSMRCRRLNRASRITASRRISKRVGRPHRSLRVIARALEFVTTAQASRFQC